ncbi:MAG: hypothetical protein ABIO02_00330 [Patescibacteria group bacterium]
MEFFKRHTNNTEVTIERQSRKGIGCLALAGAALLAPSLMCAGIAIRGEDTKIQWDKVTIFEYDKSQFGNPPSQSLHFFESECFYQKLQDGKDPMIAGPIVEWPTHTELYVDLTPFKECK